MLQYVCISDLHAGAPTSLLMNLPENGVLRPPMPSAVTTGFVAVMTALLGTEDRPQLILLGDILDLQFSDRTHAYQNAQGFLSALSNSGCFADDLIATAGNHDHALWTDARLALYLKAMSANGVSYTNATPAFCNATDARSRMLDALVIESGFCRVDLRYPNIGLSHDGRAVLLHHGHFFEDPYLMITTLRDLFSEGDRVDLTVADIAGENAGWIDFLWATIGDAGLSQDASDLYQNMLTSAGFRRLSAKLAVLFSDEMGAHLPLAGDLRVREALRIAARVSLDVTAGKFRDTERYAEVEAFSHKGRDGLTRFLSGPVRKQIMDELGEVPDDLTVIFGHTHKPFADRIKVPGFDVPLKVYNTGGWVLNGPRLDTKEGASMMMIDDDLNVVALRLFTTPQDGKVPVAYLEVLSEPRASMQAFVAELQGRLAGDDMQTLLKSFAATVCVAYMERQAMLLDLTAQEGPL
jgi:predicted phosphodiesterase